MTERGNYERRVYAFGEYSLRRAVGEDAPVELWNFEIYPGYRRKGLGTVLVHDALAVARMWMSQALFIRLYVKIRNRRAVALYKKTGFVIAARSREKQEYTMSRFL